MDSKSNLLGPVTGERTLLASHGAGRLERHDGTKVLFLKGSPEDMGEQHGTLLKDEVRDLVKRVLYGVGIGSSFEKGRWFFGEIEQCVSRLSPYIDNRTLREMDAMAHAAGTISRIRCSFVASTRASLSTPTLKYVNVMPGRSGYAAYGGMSSRCAQCVFCGARPAVLQSSSFV